MPNNPKRRRKASLSEITDRYRQAASGLPGWVQKLCKDLERVPNFECLLSPGTDPYDSLVMYGGYEQGLGIRVKGDRIEFINPARTRRGDTVFHTCKKGCDVKKLARDLKQVITKKVN